MEKVNQLCDFFAVHQELQVIKARLAEKGYKETVVSIETNERLSLSFRLYYSPPSSEGVFKCGIAFCVEEIRYASYPITDIVVVRLLKELDAEFREDNATSNRP